MATSGGGGGIHVLCDDALAEILVRLPSVSVLRCGAVCRSWRRVTAGSAFLAAHAARRPRELVIWGADGALETIPFSLGPLDPDRQQYRRFLCDYAAAHKGQCEVCYSVDGLLLLRQCSGLYAVCNPATRQWTSLPRLVPEPCYDADECGFYLHSPSGEYRLLCRGQVMDPGGAFQYEKTKSYYYVLSAGAAAPRRLGSAPWRWCQLGMYKDPVSHRGSLHWLSEHPEADSTGKMLAFDTASETFRLMSRPPDTCGMMMRFLFELDGELNVAAMRSLTSLDVWVLQDYGRETWALHCRVEVPMPWYYGYNKVSVRKVIPFPTATGSGGAILIGSPGCPVARVYDIKEKRVICLGFTFFQEATLMFLEYRESLVRHAFFDSPSRCHDLFPMLFSTN